MGTDGSRQATYPRRAVSKAGRAGGGRQSSRSKLNAILDSATNHFAASGFDDARWASVAEDVGIGQTALYHYFESKLHCLFSLMAVSLRETHERFEETLASNPNDPVDLLRALLTRTFELSRAEMLRSRIVVSEQGRLSTPRSSSREEAARREARRWIRQVESDWENFLADGMEGGQFSPQNPQLLSRAVIGLLSSVWHWYRPSGSLPIAEVADFFVDQSTRMILVQGYQ